MTKELASRLDDTGTVLTINRRKGQWLVTLEWWDRKAYGLGGRKNACSISIPFYPSEAFLYEWVGATMYPLEEGATDARHEG